MYKVLINKQEVQHSVETIYNSDLAKFTKGEIMAMFPKNVVDIRMPRRDVWDRLIGPTIIKLKFENDALDPGIIIGGENIQLRIKRDTYFM